MRHLYVKIGVVIGVVSRAEEPLGKAQQRNDGGYLGDNSLSANSAP